ncbi:trypsin-like peptidase domain-containing protein [Nocardioides bigeumensis]|uniref:Trypsin-like peptidase domain-containing protein n=2 Tax=Nocardioides bigeumensis TaxID=433657 RepID=A0ABN2YLV1_9ACTN
MVHMTHTPTAPPQYPAAPGPISSWPAPPPPAHPGHPTPSGPPPRPRRAGFAAGVLAAALVVGGGAGVGGAALYVNAQDEPATTPASSTGNDGATVSNAPDRAADGSVESVAAEVLPSVVQIEVSSEQGAGTGSGIILSEDGRILTNNHVVEGAGPGGQIRVSFNDGTTALAEVVGTDPLTDTAVIQAQDVSGLTPATIGDSSGLQVGQDVVAIGSPYGLDATVTSGIVSALNRPVNVGSDDQGNSTTYPAIQTDAAINPGNSGGPLVDMNGDVVGINSSIRTASNGTGEAGSIGLGFSIPINEVLPIVDQMVAGETPTHARLGISVGDSSTDTQGEGAVVREVTAGSAAGQAGLEPGDVITKVDDLQITGADSLVATIRSYRPGDTVKVTYLRDGESSTADVQLDSDATE